MTDPILSVHRPFGSDTWQVVERKDGKFTVLASGLSNEQAWALKLVRYFGDDPEVLRTALESLVEIEGSGWKCETALRVLREMEES